jgi:hypothetical protein
MKVIDLVNTILPVVVKFKSTKVKDFSGEWLTYQGWKVPEVALIVKIMKQDSHNVFVTLWKPKDSIAHPSVGYMPNDFDLEILEGEEKDKFLLQRREAQMKDLPNALNPGWKPTIASTLNFFMESEKGTLVPALSTQPTYYNKLGAQIHTGWYGCLDQLTGNVWAQLFAISSLIPKGSKPSMLSLIPVEEEVLAKVSANDRGLWAPSENAYGIKLATVDDLTKLLVRPAASTMHFQFHPQYLANKDKVVRYVKALDAVVGVACVSLLAGIDDPKRRLYTGAAGDYYLKMNDTATTLGYTTLSPFWALIHPLIQHLTFDLARKALALETMGFLDFWKAPEQVVIDTIMESNVDKARSILTENREVLSGMFQSVHYAGKPQGDAAADIFIKGAMSVVKKADILDNWKAFAPHGSLGAQTYYRWANGGNHITGGGKI